MTNKWCLLPHFMHILLANKCNISLNETVKDPKVAWLVIYAIRHHVHNHGFSNIGNHVCMPMYNLQFTSCLGKDQSQMILAALYLTEIINATLTTIHVQKEYLSEKRRRSVDHCTANKASQIDKRSFTVIFYDEQICKLP